MDKVQFLNLDIDDKINYLNEKLSEGQTVIRIREDIGIGEKSLQKIVKKYGYKYSQKDRLYYKHTTDMPQLSFKENNVLPKSENIKHTTNMLQAYKNDLIELISVKDEILNIVKEHREGLYYKDTTDIIEVVASNGINIKEFNSNARATSVRIYDETLEKWKEFCSENKKYSNQDLLSMALEEYIEKYKNTKL